LEFDIKESSLVLSTEEKFPLVNKNSVITGVNKNGSIISQSFFSVDMLNSDKYLHKTEYSVLINSVFETYS